MTDRSRLAVLGSPIAHSRSPLLHRAAYRALGLDWEYEAVEVGPGALDGFVGGLDARWRGLSLTMPLKREILPLLDVADETTGLVGAANTVLFDDGRVFGFNTDVHGAAEAMREAGVPAPGSAIVLGAGATASSVLAALAGLGARRVRIATRSPQKAGGLVALAERLGLDVLLAGLDSVDGDFDLVVSTIPGAAELPLRFSEALRASTPLLDIAYDPWPTALARHWLEADGTAYSGLGMLLHQALAQVRVFVHGDPFIALEHEDAVLAAMRGALEAGGA